MCLCALTAFLVVTSVCHLSAAVKGWGLLYPCFWQSSCQMSGVITLASGSGISAQSVQRFRHLHSWPGKCATFVRLPTPSFETHFTILCPSSFSPSLFQFNWWLWGVSWHGRKKEGADAESADVSSNFYMLQKYLTKGGKKSQIESKQILVF